MINHTYYIDGKPYIIKLDDTQEYLKGSDIVLSDEDNDVSFKQQWYKDGYTVKSFLDGMEFSEIKIGITQCVLSLIQKVIGNKVCDFTLENYHKIILSDDHHYKVVEKTRDLFSKDFNFSIEKMIPKFEKILNFPLTDIDPNSGWRAHIILRINRPNSTDYNPPHKDIYEHYDDQSYIPKFINFWVPICGVTSKSMLPIAPKTHRLPESTIIRTRVGGLVGENKYRVRVIKNWNDDVSLYRFPIDYGQVLIFSSHLVHGLSINEELDTTRVALEFRLYKKN